MPDWKETLNLPRTGFRMKAGLPTTEPDAIARWEEMDLYGRIRARRRGAPRYVLHDGPPYANGEIHVGTALNKILKDFVVRARTMAGCDAPYVPGWDCHGLPIELRVDRELGKRKREMSVADVRRECRRYAERYVDIQRAGFKRLGVLGDWSAPYLTMRPAYQATIVRALGRFVEQGLVYRGKKPVHWCIKCRTALAEAEVEYEEHKSPSIYVEFPIADESLPALGALAPGLADRAAGVLIWTTTPWTIPSNLAIAFHPEVTYAAYETTSPNGRAGAVIVAEPLARRVAGETGHVLGTPLGTFRGADLEGLRFRHPLYERDSVAVLADYVTLDQGTGAVHTAPAMAPTTSTRGSSTTWTSTRRSGRAAISRTTWSGSGGWGSSKRIRTWRRRLPSAADCGSGPTSSIRTLTAGAATIRSSSSPHRSGSSLSTAASCGSARSTPSRASSGFPRGARSGSATWWPTGPTGAYRASGHGACRSRRSTARRAERRR